MKKEKMWAWAKKAPEQKEKKKSYKQNTLFARAESQPVWADDFNFTPLVNIFKTEFCTQSFNDQQ
jgi:hypothetical protein